MAEAQTRVARPPPPAPVAGWETCAASRLEWAAQAAVPVDLLSITYARWCAAHGESVLAEEKVLAWLTQRGTTVRTGSLSGITAVEGGGSWTEGHLLASRRDDLTRAYALSTHPALPE